MDKCRNQTSRSTYEEDDIYGCDPLPHTTNITNEMLTIKKGKKSINQTNS